MSEIIKIYVHSSCVKCINKKLGWDETKLNHSLRYHCSIGHTPRTSSGYCKGYSEDKTIEINY